MVYCCRQNSVLLGLLLEELVIKKKLTYFIIYLHLRFFSWGEGRSRKQQDLLRHRPMLVEECYTTPAVIGSEGISLNGCSCCQTFLDGLGN